MLEPWRDIAEPLLAADHELASLWGDFLSRLEPARPESQTLARIALLESVQAVARRLAARHPAQAAGLEDLLQSREAAAFHRVGLALAQAALLDGRGDVTEASRLLMAVRASQVQDLDAATAVMLRVALGRLLVMQGDEVGATAVLLEGIALASTHGAKQQEAKMLGNLGFLYGESGGQPFEAFTRRALDLGREIGDLRLVAHSLCNLGAALAAQGNLAEARRCYDEGLPLAEHLGWSHSVALFHAGIGGVLARSGDVDAGLELYERSSAWFLSAGDFYQVARLSLSVAQHLWRIGRIEETLENLHRCLVLCGQTSYRNLEWQALALQGEVLDHQGDIRGALESLRSSLRIRQDMSDAHNAERMRLLELHMESERARAAAHHERRKAEELAGLAFRDPLTGLYNRRFMDEAIATELARSRRRGHPCVLVLVDADHFKAINDRLGHQVGDEVLVELAKRLRGSLRTEDTVARWGGEEFCLLLSETEETQGVQVVERLIERVRATPVSTTAGPVAVTVSAGMTIRNSDDATAEALLNRADLALYAAKHQGRNRACVQR